MAVTTVMAASAIRVAEAAADPNTEVAKGWTKDFNRPLTTSEFGKPINHLGDPHLHRRIPQHP